MRLALSLFVAFLIVRSEAIAFQSNDWPEFRGPNRDGICTETGLLKEWPEGGPPKVWTTTNLGLGYCTPIFADGKIYGMGTRDEKDGVWALNELDGSEIWFTPFDDPRNINQNNGPSGSPTYADGKLYAVSSKGKLVCLDATSGKSVWEKDYVSDYGGSVPMWGFTDSPLVDGDQVIAVPASDRAAVVAFHRETGDELWVSQVSGGVGKGAGYSSVIKAEIAGKSQYVVLLGDKAGVVGMDPANGNVLWKYAGKAAAGGVAQIPIPIIYNDHIWVSCSYDGGSALLKIAEEDDQFQVKPVKTYVKRQLNNHHGGMVQVDDHVYFGHDQNKGRPVCVDLKTGEIKWGPVREPARGLGSAAVLYADERLYFRYQNGVIVLIEPSPDELKVVSSFQLEDPSGREHWPHPVIVNQKMYIRDQENLHCFDVKQ